jgi:hypothetical protein
MKTYKWIFATALVFCTFTSISAQEAASEDCLFSWQGRNAKHTLSLYGEINASYAEVRNQPSGFLGTKFAVLVDRHWGLGIAQKVLRHNYDLKTLVSDGEYQFQAGYAGWFLEYLLPLGDRIRCSFSLTSGYGLAKYEYKNEFKLDHTWYERVIDQDVFHINEPAVGMIYRCGKNWWLGVDVSYRNIGNLNMRGTDSAILTGFSGGVSLKYGIF